MSIASTNVGLSTIQTALGGENPIYISEYYANATPGYSIGVAGVPSTSSQIGIGNFTGKTIPTTITINNSGGTLTDFTVNFTLNYKATYASTFQDLRFYDEQTRTLLSHWYETVSNGSSANVWVRLPSLTNGMRIKVTTGDSLTTGTPSSVFPLYENFSSFNTSTVWTASTASYTASTDNFQFTSGGPFVYMVTRSNYPANMVVEANVSSGNVNAIPEIIMRGNISANTGIKTRVDCRAAAAGGTGSYLNTPFSGWNILNAPYNFSFPSNGTFQKLTMSGSSSNFAFSYNNTLTSTYTNSASDLNNASGVIGFANHNGTPVSLQWIRAYPSTSNVISVSIT
jgi:hypothetical protein